MSKRLKVGIIGGGGIAGMHVNVYKKLSNVEVVAVSDVVPGKARQFIADQQLNGATPYEDYKQMLELDLDAVSICTPNVAHYQPTIDALNAGIHVMVEKPLSVTLQEGIDMVRKAEEVNRLLNVGFQSRYAPNVMMAKKLIADGELGRVYYAEAGGGRRKGIPGGTFVSRELAGGGVMLDIGCYSVDTTMHLIGNPRPLTVSAVTSAHFGTSSKYATGASWGRIDPSKFDVEDFSTAFIRLEGNINLIIRISWAMHMDTLGPTIILGTDQGMKLDDRSLKLYHDVAGKSAETDIAVNRTNWEDMWMEKVGQFVDAITNESPAPIPASEILYGQAILDGIYRSAAAGREVTIDLP